MSKPKVLIAGGGIGGLTLALALLQRGYRVEVYEQAPELKEVGAGVQLSPNGSRVMYALGVGERIAETSCETPGKEIRLWSTGQVWAPFDIVGECIQLYGFPYFTLYRPDLLAVLEQAVRAAGPDVIHLGKKAAGFDDLAEHVRLRFTDGSSAEGDILIGCDGIHSAIRHQLWGEAKAQFTGLFAWRGVIPTEKLPERLLRPVATNWVGPGRHVVQYPLRQFKLMNLVGVVEGQDWSMPESWTARGTHAEMHRDFDGWHPDIHLMIDSIETPFRWAFLARDPLMTWGRGNVSLLGDACHPTLPFLAQGAVHAVEDAYVLARALDEIDDPREALRRYEAARVERTARMVRGSTDNTKRFHNPELAHAEGAAAYVEREWQPEKVRARYEWLYTYDATTVEV